MKKTLLLASLISAVLFAMLCTAFILVPGFSKLIWVSFSTFAIVNALQGDMKKAHIYLGALVLGWLWAYSYNYALLYLMSLFGISFPVAMFISVLVVTFIIVAVHAIVLAKTPFNTSIMPMAFMPVMAFFGTMGQGLSTFNIIIAQVLGIYLATTITLLVSILIRSSMKAAEDFSLNHPV